MGGVLKRVELYFGRNEGGTSGNARTEVHGPSLVKNLEESGSCIASALDPAQTPPSFMSLCLEAYTIFLHSKS